MPFYLMSECCDQCLMTKNKIVSDSRRREIIKTTMAKDCSFVCHKSTISGRDIACKGHYNATGGGQMARIAERLGSVVLVDPKTLAEPA